MKELTGLSCSDIFPEGFSPRPSQTKCVDESLRYIESGGKFIIINAATGAGKSHIAAALTNITSDPTDEYKHLINSYSGYTEEGAGKIQNEPPCNGFILTTTKSLQDQYINTFKKSATLKGKANYQCVVDPECAVDYAPCIITPKLKGECQSCNKCPYYNNIISYKKIILFGSSCLIFSSSVSVLSDMTSTEPDTALSISETEIGSSAGS